MYESRIISTHQHLRNIKDKSEIHEYVYESEDNNIVRVGYELLQRGEIEDNINEKPRRVSKTFSTKEQNLKKRNIATKKSTVTFTTNSKATVKLTRISVTDAQLTKT